MPHERGTPSGSVAHCPRPDTVEVTGKASFPVSLGASHFGIGNRNSDLALALSCATGSAFPPLKSAFNCPVGRAARRRPAKPFHGGAIPSPDSSFRFPLNLARDRRLIQSSGIGVDRCMAVFQTEGPGAIPGCPTTFRHVAQKQSPRLITGRRRSVTFRGDQTSLDGVELRLGKPFSCRIGSKAECLFRNQETGERYPHPAPAFTGTQRRR